MNFEGGKNMKKKGEWGGIFDFNEHDLNNVNFSKS